MDTLPIKFPHIAEEIFRYLDHQSLENCYHVCQSWKKILDNVKFIWTGLTNGHPGWVELFNATSFEIISVLEDPFLELELEEGLDIDFWLPKEKQINSGIEIHPIFCAVHLDNPDIFKTLTILYPKFQELVIKSHKYTPMPLFHFAAKEGKLEIVKFFINLAAKENVNPKDCNGTTPLHEASSHGHFEIVKILLENIKGEKNPANDKGDTPLHMAPGGGNVEIVQILLDNIEGDKNPGDQNGWTPLHEASLNGEFEIVELILENMDGGKNPKDCFDITPLHMASKFNHFEIVKLLLDNIKGEKNPVDHNGETPLNLACDQETKNLIQSYL